jgi:Flp pilus assembly secretin CpaC
MRCLLAVCAVLALAITARGQQGNTGPHAAASCEPRPGPTGQRLEQLRRTAGELEQAGNLEQAAAVHRQAEAERLTLLGRLDALETEAEQVRQALGAGTQVVVQMQVVELPITKLRALGFDLTKILTRASGPSVAKVDADQIEGNPQADFFVSDGNHVQGVFAALREDKLLKVLAEPTLMTLSGRTAVLEVGDVPVPKKQPDGSVTIEHRSATMMRVTPEVLGNRVRLAIHCRLAKLDPSHTLRVGQETVPCVPILEFDTGAELASGQTLVLAGPMQARTESQQRGVPYVSEIPYVGAAFRSVEETRNEVATYVLVRAEIVQRPAAASPIANVKPGAAVPVPRPPHPVSSFDGAPSATARRSPDGDVRR